MTIHSIRKLGIAAATLAALASPALAAEPKVLGSEGDWTAFGGDAPKECWAVSPPKSTRNTDAEGNPREVTRSDIRLYIAYRPGQNGEVSFQGGYPFAPDSTVEVDVGGTKFKLFTEGESAWTGSPDEDAKLIGALRAGSNAVVTGRSSRGTRTADTFSLAGITAMTNTARETCK
ncbi:invasion associated locus B family protein [Paracoccus luteus]|uniref:invasion associated locus B family protein n=1 Tax=Paracoccus luteus TaxID=2508543 RepID=UPI00106F554F|nr:invasion associated locus B family protein [Paracoccus luteus]